MLKLPTGGHIVLRVLLKQNLPTQLEIDIHQTRQLLITNFFANFSAVEIDPKTRYSVDGPYSPLLSSPLSSSPLVIFVARFAQTQ